MNHNSSKKYTEILQKFFYSETMGKYSLEKIEKACRYFGNPQESFKSIHIAGTNGKGSVAKMIFQILKDSGKKVGVYTSPHIVDIRERFETQKGGITREQFIYYAEEVILYAHGLSYFEKCVLLAFLFFREQGCEYAVIETGLGGRLDATNIVNPILSIITSISYDHTDYLGDTLEEISYEKAGIIKQNIPLILYGRNKVIQEKARVKNARVIFPAHASVSSKLLGRHQEKNAAIAFEAGIFLGFSREHTTTSLQYATHKGRLDFILDNVLLDGAHNEAGLRALYQYIESHQYKWENIEYFYASKKGKHIDTLIDIFPKIQKWNIIHTDIDILETSKILKRQFDKKYIRANIVTPSDIFVCAQKNPQTLYLVFGSLYVLQEFYISS